MNKYEVVIIGGSFAGLSAALPLLRARKRVLIIDAGIRRNRFAEHSHNFLTQDGRAPAEIIQEAKLQIDKYSTLTWLIATVSDVKAIANFFEIQTDEHTVIAEKVIIATGVKDVLPEIEGLAERWGKTIFHCPYCDGYELNLGNIGVVASSLHSIHTALMLPDWGATTLFLNDAIDIHQISDEVLAHLERRQVNIDTRKIAQIDGHCDVIFTNGESVQLDGLFVSTYMKLQADWIQTLGLEIDVNEYGEAIKTSATKQTNLPNIYACGDVTRFGGSVALSVGDGAMTGIAVHKSFIFNS